MPLTAAAFLATPDTPLTIFSIVVLMGLIEVWRSRAWGWAVVGVALGLALQTKFSALFLVGGIALAAIITPSLRRWSHSPAPYAAALVAAAIFAPFVAWNATHGWETFIKQFGRVPAHKLELRHLPEFIVSGIGVANPFFVVAGAGWLIVQMRIERPPVSREVEARRILVAYMAPAVIYFLVHALHDHVQVNWLALVFPALAMLVGAAAANGPPWVRRAAGGGVVFGCLTIALLAVHVVTMWPSPGAAELLARRIGGWRALTSEVDSRARSEGAGFIFADGYASTSLLTFYGDGAIPVLQAQDRERWQFLPPPDMQVFDRPGLAFTGVDGGVASELARHFRHVEPLGRLARKWQGTDVAEFQLFRVSGAIPPVFE